MRRIFVYVYSPLWDDYDKYLPLVNTSPFIQCDANNGVSSYSSLGLISVMVTAPLCTKYFDSHASWISWHIDIIFFSIYFFLYMCSSHPTLITG